MPANTQREPMYIDLEDLDWSAIKRNRDWLEEHNNIEATTLVQFINELWMDNVSLYWSMMWQQKAWLESIVDDTDADELLFFLEVFQDRAMDSEEFTAEEIYGYGHIVEYTAPLVATKKRENPHGLKLVVSNYFRPLERIDQPCKPDPVLRILK